MQTYIFNLFLLLFLASCTTGNDNTSTNPNAIWSDTSASIEISQFNGYTPSSENRYTTYSYNTNSLTNFAIEKLSSISLTTVELSCHEDNISYQVSITDDSGATKIYHSNNKACNDYSALEFVSTEDMEQLIDLFE